MGRKVANALFSEGVELMLSQKQKYVYEDTRGDSIYKA